MKRVNNAIRALALMVLVCMMLTSTVFAAGNGSAWLNVTESSAEETTTAVIAADTTVTDGLVELAFDSSVLTYEDVTVNDSVVAMYAVNADEAGLVKISWVAPEAYSADGAAWLIQVHFSGLEESSTITLSGTMNGADGSQFEQGENLDTTGLKAALETAKGLYKGNYTYRSFKAVENAMKQAEAVLADPAATQAEVDAAEAALNDAMAALECKVLKDTSKLIRAITKANRLDKSKYTEESYAAVEEALADAKAVLADPYAKQQDVDNATKALNDAMDALVKISDTPEEPGNPGYPGDGIIGWIGRIIRGFFGWINRG